MASFSANVQTEKSWCWGVRGSRTLETGCWNIRQARTHRMSIRDLKEFLDKSQFCFCSQAFATCRVHPASVGPVVPAGWPPKVHLHQNDLHCWLNCRPLGPNLWKQNLLRWGKDSYANFLENYNDNHDQMSWV